MEVRQDTFDPNKGLIKIESDPVSGQPEQNSSPFEKVRTVKTEYKMLDVGEIKQEFIKCEDPVIEQLSDVKIEDTGGDIREIKDTNLLLDKITIKQEASEIVHFKTESELLTSHCDLPTLKDESDLYLDNLEPCSSKQAERISKCLKSTAKYVSNKKKRRYQCPVCLKSFPSSKSRLDHYIKHFGKRSVNNRSSLWRRKHTDSSFEKYQACSYCQCFIFNKSQFLTHFIVHHYVKKIQKRFFFKSELVKNIKTNTKKKLFKCEICSKNFNLKSNLFRHLLIHTDRKRISCEICSKTFTKKCNLTEHLKIHAEKQFKCEICSKQFTRKRNLANHSIIHLGEKPFKCEICSNQYVSKFSLTSHLKIHIGEKPFDCKICSKQFIHKGSLNRHSLVHTVEKPFKCEICLKQFVTKSRLATHLKLHTKEQLFECKICLKAFNRKSDLSSHLKLHTGEKSVKF